MTDVLPPKLSIDCHYSRIVTVEEQQSVEQQCLSEDNVLYEPILQDIYYGGQFVVPAQVSQRM